MCDASEAAGCHTVMFLRDVQATTRLVPIAVCGPNCRLHVSFVEQFVESLHVSYHDPAWSLYDFSIWVSRTCTLSTTKSIIWMLMAIGTGETGVLSCMFLL